MEDGIVGNWSDYEMVCNDCGVTMLELERGR